METAYIIETIIKVIIVLTVFSALAGFTTYIERKVLSIYAKATGTHKCRTLWTFTISS